MNFDRKKNRTSYKIEDILGIKDIPMKSDAEISSDDGIELSPTYKSSDSESPTSHNSSSLESSLSEGKQPYSNSTVTTNNCIKIYDDIDKQGLLIII